MLAGLGAGFKKISQEENVFLSGSIYGISSDELHDLVPSIVVFSGIGKFIDQPLRTYSSGMRARLAFSIACHLSPDILLIDEVLMSGIPHSEKNPTANHGDGAWATVVIGHNAVFYVNLHLICLNNGKIDLITEDVEEAIQRYRHLSENNQR